MLYKWLIFFFQVIIRLVEHVSQTARQTDSLSIFLMIDESSDDYSESVNMSEANKDHHPRHFAMGQ